MKYEVWTAAIAMSAMVSACHKPVTRINGPSESKEGIKVELLNVKCDRIGEDGDMFDEIELDMELAVNNGSDQAVQFRPNRMRIIGSGGAKPVWGGPGVPIPKGARRVTQVRFFDSSGVRCRDRMKLDLADSLTSGEAIRAEPIGFVFEE